MLRARNKPLFAHATPSERGNSKQANGNKGDVAAQQLRRELGNNTRAAMDPFLSPGNAVSSMKSTTTVLRRKDPNTTDSTSTPSPPDSKQPGSLLVDYDSD